MRKLEQATYDTINITSDHLLHAYTADDNRLVFVRLFLSGVAGGGDYLAYVTVQRGGVGSEFYIVPLTITPVDSGYGAICLASVAIPADEDDVVRAYVRGLGPDSDIDAIVEVWEDDSNFYSVIPTTYPTGTLGNALARIGSEPTIRVQVPLQDTSSVTIVAGDDYLAEHDTALTFSSEQWPSVLGATIDFVTQEITIEGSVLGAGEVMVEFLSEESAVLQSGYASLVATYPDGHKVTLIQRLKLRVISPITTQ